MNQPSAPPVGAVPVDLLAQALAGQGYAVVYTTSGGEPSLAFVDGQLRGYLRGPRAGELTVLRFAGAAEATTITIEGLAVAAGDQVRVVPLYMQGEREWLAVIEATQAREDPAVAPPWRVHLVERTGERGRLLRSHDSYAHADNRQARSRYERTGELAVVGFAGSLYAVAGGAVVVLDGPGKDAPRFMERPDPDCPPNKRCYPLPAEIDVKQFVGYAPGGRDLVMAGEGRVVRRDVATGATSVFGYNNFFYAGLVEDDAVVLAHAGEPPFVERWRPARASGSPPFASGSGRTALDVQTGEAQRLAEGAIYTQLARTGDGVVYGVSGAGALDRLVDGRAAPVVRLPADRRVVAVAAADALAFVVANDGAPPVHAIVVAAPGP